MSEAVTDAAARDYFERMGALLTGQDDPNVELLLPPLRKSLWESPNAGLMLKHPWVNLIAPFTGLANDLYISKFAMARELLSKRDLHMYLLFCVERPWRMSILQRWWLRDKLSREEAQQLLLDCWMDTEVPSTNLDDPALLWRELGFITDDPEGWKKLPDPLTVWRGGIEEGVSWTLGREQAEWFAKRFVFADNVPQLWSTTVSKSEVLGWLTGRQEEEIILDPYEVEWEREELSDAE